MTRRSRVKSGYPTFGVVQLFCQVTRLLMCLPDQDERARQDDIAVRAQRAQRQADMRRALEAQLEEADTRRQAEQAERSREGVALTQQIAQVGCHLGLAPL
jgi:hypothetical protein